MYFNSKRNFQNKALGRIRIRKFLSSGEQRGHILFHCTRISKFQGQGNDLARSLWDDKRNRKHHVKNKKALHILGACRRIYMFRSQRIHLRLDTLESRTNIYKFPHSR